MSLRPRKFKYKNIHKRRFFRFSNLKVNKLTYGQLGLVLLQPLRLNSKQIFRYKLFFKKASRRSDKTLRFVWFNLFPHIPLSRKVEGSRMGKGKGKLAGWSTELPAGLTVFEFKNLRYGRAAYFCKQVSHKIPAKVRLVRKLNKNISSTWNLNKKFAYDIIW